MRRTRPRLLGPAPLRAALTAGAAVAVLTACGGGSGTSTASGSSSATAPTSSSSASSTAATAAAGGDFCAKARTFASQAGQALAAGTGNPSEPQQLQALVTQLQAITPPPAVASDWQSAVSTLQQFVAAYQGVNLGDPAQVQAFAQKVQPLTQQLAASGQRIDQYLQNQCGLSVGDTGSASPSS
jgi:hypothetical protein